MLPSFLSRAAAAALVACAFAAPSAQATSVTIPLTSLGATVGGILPAVLAPVGTALGHKDIDFKEMSPGRGHEKFKWHDRLDEKKDSFDAWSSKKHSDWADFKQGLVKFPGLGDLHGSYGGHFSGWHGKHWHKDKTPAVHEPSTYALMALGLAGVAAVARKRVQPG